VQGIHDAMGASLASAELAKTYDAIASVTGPLALALQQIHLPRMELSPEVIRSADSLNAIMGPANELRAMGALNLPEPDLLPESALGLR
jgi:hypothetical protein